MAPLAPFEIVEIPLARLHSASWNANRVPKDVLGKIARSLDEFGIVENSIVRPLPAICPYCQQATDETHYEIVSGNHRYGIYQARGLETAPCVIRELSDADARVLAQVMNRTRGADDEDAKRDLYATVIEEADIQRLLDFLPEDEASIRKLIADLPEPGDEDSYAPPDVWGVVVDCNNETDQAQLLERLTEEGFKCRALML